MQPWNHAKVAYVRGEHRVPKEERCRPDHKINRWNCLSKRSLFAAQAAREMRDLDCVWVHWHVQQELFDEVSTGINEHWILGSINAMGEFRQHYRRGVKFNFARQGANAAKQLNMTQTAPLRSYRYACV